MGSDWQERGWNLVARRRPSGPRRACRLVLQGSVAALCASCIAPLPTIEAEPRARPNLSLSEASPLPSQLMVVQYGEQPQFTVPVSFATEGSYYYQFWLNWDLAPALAPLAGFTLKDTDLAVVRKIPINSQFARGCQQITLLVTYTDNLTNVPGEPNVPILPELVASATWWLNVDPQGAPEDLVDCPLKGAATPTE